MLVDNSSAETVLRLLLQFVVVIYTACKYCTFITNSKAISYIF